MSATYPDYSKSKFPDAIDTFDYFVDVDTSTYPLVQQYYALYNSGDIDGATAYLEANPSLSNCIINADKLNQFIDAHKAEQTYYFADVQEWIVNAVKDRGDFSATTKYQKFNVVGYYIDGATEAYMCLSNDTPIGTLPTNTTYWRAITLRGKQGASGIGLTAQGTWSPLVTYPANSMVAYNNALWGSLIENVEIVPSTTATATWYKIIEFNSDYLTYTDTTKGMRYKMLIDNGRIYMEEVS